MNNATYSTTFHLIYSLSVITAAITAVIATEITASEGTIMCILFQIFVFCYFLSIAWISLTKNTPIKRNIFLHVYFLSWQWGTYIEPCFLVSLIFVIQFVYMCGGFCKMKSSLSKDKDIPRHLWHSPIHFSQIYFFLLDKQ